MKRGTKVTTRGDDHTLEVPLSPVSKVSDEIGTIDLITDRMWSVN